MRHGLQRPSAASTVVRLCGCLLLVLGGVAARPRPRQSAGKSSNECGPLLDNIPADAATHLNTYTPAFLALADMAYGYDHVSHTPRSSPLPCLSAWGARSQPVLVGRGASDSDRFGFVFRTRRDVFVSLRGMDSIKSLGNYMVMTPVFDPQYFGAPALKVSPPQTLPWDKYRLMRPFADPKLFWVIKRHYDDTRSIDNEVANAVDSAIKQMDPSARNEARIWLTGHSSGGALAQLLALRLAQRFGQQRIGGVLIFNSDRTGSEAFARYYDGVLGSRTLRYGYGLDNANMVYNKAMGLRYPGRAFWACPVSGSAVEKLVTLPLGEDRVEMCKGLIPWPRKVDLETKDDVTSRHPFPYTAGLPALSTIEEWDSFSHHIPSLQFDSLLRILGNTVNTCTRKALDMQQCVVSKQCAAALRGGSKLCHTCADDKTCRETYGLGSDWKCDTRVSLYRSNLCYNSKPHDVPPILAGLFYPL